MNAVALAKGCYVGTKVSEIKFSQITTSETIFSTTVVSDWHYHQRPHYSHIISGGSKEIRPGSAQQQTQGQGLYYFPGIPHQNLQYRPDTRIFNLEIDYSFFNMHQLSIPDEEQMLADPLPVNTAGLLNILKEHRWQDEYSGLAIELLCAGLVAATGREVKFYPDWTKKIITVLNDNRELNLSLTELSGFLQIHPVTLSKYFSKYFNCTLGQYMRRLKVEKALKLIGAKKFTLTDIGYMCGFSDQAHFTKTFLSLTGMLPKQYSKL